MHRKVVGRIITEEEFLNLEFGWNRVIDILPPTNEKVLLTIIVFPTKWADKLWDSMTEKEKEPIYKKFNSAQKTIDQWSVNALGTGEYKFNVIDSRLEYREYGDKNKYIYCGNCDKNTIIIAWSKYPIPFTEIETNDFEEASQKLKEEYRGFFGDVIDKLTIKFKRQ